MKVHVKDFQSLKDATLEVEGLTVLVGPSDLGKSALVRAIEGALFNRPGDYFVRNGASSVEVHLSGVPSVQGPPLDVVWRKGAGKNEFTIDGARYDKVGTDAPPPLVAAGYREVGEEEVRPQIATQFDRLFLLDRPGSVVADILTALSHVMVVSAADRLCATDVRETKRTEALRRVDLAQADEDLARTGEVEGLYLRVQGVKALAAQVVGMSARADVLRALLVRRAQLQTIDLRPLAPPLALPDDLGVVWERALPLVARRGVLGRLGAVSLPVAVAVDLREDVPDIRALVQARQRVVWAAQTALPVATRGVELIQSWQEQASGLAGLVAQQQKGIAGWRSQEASARAAREEAAHAAAAFAEAMAVAKVCPLCGQPAALDVCTQGGAL